MNEEYLNFGDFIAKKREEKQISLREMARKIDVSAPYLSDVEKDRRNPFDIDKLELIANILLLSDGDRIIMLELAGKRRKEVAPDLPNYIMERHYVSAALRTAKDLNASEDEWLAFVEDLKRRKG